MNFDVFCVDVGQKSTAGVELQLQPVKLFTDCKTTVYSGDIVTK